MNQLATVPEDTASVRNVGAYLDAMRGKIDEVAAASIEPDRLIKVVLTAMIKEPKLLQCTRESIFLAVMEAAAQGLEPSGPQGHAYLIPRWNRDQNVYHAHLQRGYKGLIALARRSGRVRDITAEVVREADEFRYQKGLDPKLVHVPSLEIDRGRVTHAYAIAWPVDVHAPPVFEVMSRAQIDHVKEVSAEGASPAWRNFPDQMDRKTVIRRLTNYLDLTPALADQIRKDDEGGFELDEPEKAVQLPSKTEGLVERIQTNREGTITGEIENVETTLDAAVEEPVNILELEALAGLAEPTLATDREFICEGLGIKSPVHDPDAYVARLEEIIAQKQEQEA